MKSTSGSAHCLNTAQAENVVERIEAELNIVDTKDFDPDKYLPEVLEAFSLLYFCPPHHLVEAVKLGVFYENLLEHENLRTVVMATMNNIMPDNQFENMNLLHEFFNELDKEYNFMLGPSILALAATPQLRQLAKADFHFLEDYSQNIQHCNPNCDRMVDLTNGSAGIKLKHIESCLKDSTTAFYG